jgi:signal transduction histidine kinase
VVRAIEGHTEIDAPLYYFQIHRIGRGIVFRSRNLGPLELPDLTDGGPLVRTINLHEEPARMREYYHHGYHVQVATTLEQTEALLDRYQGSLVVSLPVLFLFSLLIGWWLATLAVRPIGAMQRAARRISASNLAERLPVPPGRDEIAALARLLNELYARLEQSFDQVRRFTADASHELKTPLSLIRLHVERLSQSANLTEADRAAIGEQLEEISRLNKLVENLLLLARADAGSLALERRWQNPAVFVREFAEDATALADEAGRRFVLAHNDEGEADFDAGLLRQVALNVLANALRFTPPGRKITLESHVTGGSWELILEDEGPGVPLDQLATIFGRFVRGRPAPGASTETGSGSGLGLAIARSIVEAHGGTIHASNRPEGGLRVEARLPGVRTGQ